MDTTNGLPKYEPGEDLGPLDQQRAALRLNVGGHRIQELTPALARLMGREVGSLLGQSIYGFCSPSEHAAVRARLNDVVVYGTDRISALALIGADGSVMLVEVDARYDWQGGERLELFFNRLPIGHSGVAQGAAPAFPVPPSNGADAPLDQSADAEPAVSDAPLPVSDAPPAAARSDALELAEASGLCVLAVRTGWRVVGATANATMWVGDDAVGRRIDDLLGFCDEAWQAVDQARRDGRRLSSHAHARHALQDLTVEWLPGNGPASGWLRLEPYSDSDNETGRLLQARWFVSMISHDARGRLSEVDSGLDLLQDELERRYGVDNTLVSIIESTRAANDAALEMISDAHEMATRDADNRRHLDLGGLLREVLDRYAPRAAARGVELRDSLLTDLVVHGDRAKLQRVFTNLIDNALRHMSAGGLLLIQTEREEREAPGVRVAVSDTGPGISQDRLESIFLPRETTTPGGKGIGLTIVRQFVLDNGGQIHCESTLGEGATFFVWLPLAA